MSSSGNDVKKRKKNGRPIAVYIGLALIIIGIVFCGWCLAVTGFSPPSGVISIMSQVLAYTVIVGATIIQAATVKGDDHINLSCSPNINVEEVSIKLREVNE